MTPHQFLDFKMGFDARWPFSEISGKRTPRHNKAVGGHKDSFHQHWIAVDIQLDDDPTQTTQVEQRRYCKRQGMQIIYKSDPMYVHLEPNI